MSGGGGGGGSGKPTGEERRLFDTQATIARDLWDQYKGLRARTHGGDTRGPPR